MGKKIKLTDKEKVLALYTQLAGDKLPKCEMVVRALVADGYKFERACAEALEVFKCPQSILSNETT